MTVMNNIKRKKVSVIVPVYKVESFLVRCLDSLSRQSLRDIEIVVVDDASPDRCGEICEKYAAKDDRFKVIHHSENKGLSAARNTGIANATGDYLMFVDSDDYVHNDFCKLPYEYAVKFMSDLVIFKFQRVDQNNSVINHKKDSFKYKKYAFLQSGYKSQSEALDLLQCNSIGIGHAVWNKLYHKKIFEDVSYPEGFLFEDAGTTYKTIIKATRIYYLDNFLYYYCLRPDSITTLNTEKALNDWVTMHIQQYHDLMEWGRYSREKLDLFLQYFAMEYCIRGKRDSSNSQYTFCENALRSCKSVSKEFTPKRKFLFFMLKYCPSLFELICVLWGKKS